MNNLDWLKLERVFFRAEMTKNLEKFVYSRKLRIVLQRSLFKAASKAKKRTWGPGGLIKQLLLLVKERVSESVVCV